MPLERQSLPQQTIIELHNQQSNKIEVGGPISAEADSKGCRLIYTEKRGPEAGQYFHVISGHYS